MSSPLTRPLHYPGASHRSSCIVPFKVVNSRASRADNTRSSPPRFHHFPATTESKTITIHLSSDYLNLAQHIIRIKPPNISHCCPITFPLDKLLLDGSFMYHTTPHEAGHYQPSGEIFLLSPCKLPTFTSHLNYPIFPCFLNTSELTAY
jgi:hypothetical protein